jgi:hypothetical protein
MVTGGSYGAVMHERDELIEQIARRQRGLFTRRQTDEVGFTQKQVEHRLRIGRWTEPHHLVYALLGAQLDDRTRLLAAVLAADPRAAASHRSAAGVLGVPGFSIARPPHVTIPDHYERPRTPAVVHYTLFLPDHHRRIVDGIPCTSLARTIFDLCGTERLGRAARTMDTALSRRLVTIPALWNVLAETSARGRAGSRAMRLLLRERGVKYVPPASELERRFVQLIEQYGIEPPRRQVDLGDGDQWIGRVDFVFGTGLVVEVDGAEFHTSHLDRAADAGRDEALITTGRTVLRFTWTDVTERAAQVASVVRDHLSVARAS